MNIQCPNCLFADDIDERKIPEKGGTAKCPKCGHRFLVKRLQNPNPSLDKFSAQTVAFKAPEKQKSASANQTAGASPTVQTKPPLSLVHKLSFHGNGSALFGIQIVNILLTIITLGIYRFWGKVKVRKYLYSQTELLGDRFVYHGTGKELFIGWLKAVAFLVVGYGTIFVLTFFIHPFFNILAPFLILAIIPLALVGARRYRLSRTSWHGIRFSFRGSFKEALGLYAGGLLLTIITLGIYYPIFHAKMRSFWANNSYFGNTPFKYDGNGKDLLGSFILAVFLSIVTLGIYWFWYMAKVQQYDWEHTSFPGMSFRSTVTGGSLFVLTLTNFLLIIFTLGLAFSWVIVRTMRFWFANISLEGNLELDKIKQDAQNARATADSMADFMNIDSGLV